MMNEPNYMKIYRESSDFGKYDFHFNFMYSRGWSDCHKQVFMGILTILSHIQRDKIPQIYTLNQLQEIADTYDIWQIKIHRIIAIELDKLPQEIQNTLLITNIHQKLNFEFFFKLINLIDELQQQDVIAYIKIATERHFAFIELFKSLLTSYETQKPD